MNESSLGLTFINELEFLPPNANHSTVYYCRAASLESLSFMMNDWLVGKITHFIYQNDKTNQIQIAPEQIFSAQEILVGIHRITAKLMERHPTIENWYYLNESDVSPTRIIEKIARYYRLILFL